MKNKLPLCLMIAIFFGFFHSNLNASEYKSVGRYTEIRMSPGFEERDPLLMQVEIVFPKHISSVHEAISFVLEPTGYKLPSEMDHIDDSLVIVGVQKLPVSQKKIRGSVVDVLRALAGPNFIVVRDDVRRLVVLDYLGRE